MTSRRIIGSSGFDGRFLTNYIRFIGIKPLATPYATILESMQPAPLRHLARENAHRYTESNLRRTGYQG